MTYEDLNDRHSPTPAPGYEDHAVSDGTTVFTFRGLMIATATTEAPTKEFWSVVSLFRTDHGTYVLLRQGISRDPRDSVRSQVTRVRTAQGLVNSLYSRDANGQEFMRNLDRRLLTIAAREDARIADALSYRPVD